MEIVIRKLSKSDLPEVIKIFDEFVSYHEQHDSIFDKIASAAQAWGDYAYTSHTKDDNCQVFVAVCDKQIVGYCLGRIEEKPPIYREKIIGTVGNIAVKEGYKRQGVGEQMFKAIKEWFRENDVCHIEIEAAANNPQSVNFWKKMGGREFIKRMQIRMDRRAEK